jgi:nitrite reductase/ring-hydroxylating ferredoxin subunit
MHEHEEGLEFPFFAPGWHLVATNYELRRDGDFVTRDLWGTPVIVWHHEGQIVAFLNVCAHRHARLTHERCGSAERLRCQYHGWEYSGADGEVCTVPDAASFVPLGRKGLRERLRALRVETLGGLVFVSLKVFSGKRRGEGEVVHELDERFTSYDDSLGGESGFYRAAMQWLHPGATTDYVHHHAFPNVILGYTSMVRFVQVIEPIGPASSRGSKVVGTF